MDNWEPLETALTDSVPFPGCPTLYLIDYLIYNFILKSHSQLSALPCLIAQSSPHTCCS